jgi:hypothetical protein
MGVFTFDEKNQVEAEEPLESRTPILQFDLLGTPIVRHPDPKMVSVCFEPESVIALLPPLTETLGKQSSRRL